MRRRRVEGLKTARVLMVMSSISPLFVLWAIRGSSLVPDRYFILGCALLVAVPNLILWWRIVIAKQQHDLRPLVVGTADDHRDHLLVYLIAMLMPLYVSNLNAWRELAAAVVALALIVFLFWQLDLHYMNILFIAFGYRVFSVSPVNDKNPLSGRSTITLITGRQDISSGNRISAYRISDSVFLEVDE